MLKITGVKSRGREMSVCQKVAKRRLRLHMKRLRRREYTKLKAIVPSVAKTEKVPKVIVIEEAIKYIDELHEALLQRIGTAMHTSKNSGSSGQHDLNLGAVTNLVRHLLPAMLVKPATVYENKRKVATYQQKVEKLPSRKS